MPREGLSRPPLQEVYMNEELHPLVAETVQWPQGAGALRLRP